MPNSYPTTYLENGVITPLPNCSRPIQEGFLDNSLIINFESGHEQRRKKGEIKKTWDLTYNVLTDAAYQTLKEFFFARGATVESFTWTHPIEKTDYTVRFAGAIQGENFAHNVKTALWKATVKLQQVL